MRLITIQNHLNQFEVFHAPYVQLEIKKQGTSKYIVTDHYGDIRFRDTSLREIVSKISWFYSNGLNFLGEE